MFWGNYLIIPLLFIDRKKGGTNFQSQNTKRCSDLILELKTEITP